MRSVWFSLVGPSVAEVEALFEETGFLRTPGQSEEFRFPSIDEPALYVKCDAYQWVEQYHLQEEYAELQQAIGGVKPTVQVTADVSGRLPGDTEVRFLARLLLLAFPGFAFDDFLAYSHAWTLKQIEDGTVFNGLHFFDYKGSWQQFKSRSD